jgi:hypothetical protein
MVPMIRSFLLTAGLLCGAAALAGQTPQPPPPQQPRGQMPDLGRPTKPDDALPLFDFDKYFIGRWTFEWDMPDGPLGAAGRLEGSTVYSALGDGQYQALTEATGPTGKVTIKELITYDREKKTIARTVTDSRGFSYTQTGTVGGDLGGSYNIYFESNPITIGKQSVKLKHLLRLTSPLQYRVSATVSVDNGPFTNYGSPWWRKVPAAGLR